MKLATARTTARTSTIEILESRIAPAAVVTMDLSGLTGDNGFKISGESGYDNSGCSVSGAGDINGDGIDDLIVGATYADANGNNSGASYVVFGKDTPFAANVNLSGLTGTNGFKISGESEFDNSGCSVSGAGDINGDGIDDLIVGAWGSDPNGNNSGASYVVFGSSTPFAANVDLSGLTGTNGFKISGEAVGDNSGRSVSGAGDINGDGIGDLIVGARNANPNGNDSGASYVVFGKDTGFAANVNLSGLTGTNGFKISGEAANDNSGISVSGAGDINGDGIDDLIVGARNANPNGNDSGASYVVFGSSTPFAANVNLSGLTGTNGFKISGESEFDNSGVSVCGAGDINGDGIGDLIVGAFNAEPNGNNSGASYVVFGKDTPFAANVNLSGLTGTNGFKISGESETDRSGYSVSGAGDINGDGIDDLIVGANNADPNGNNSGASYVVFGSSTPFAANVNLSDLTGTNGFKISGESEYDNSGISVSGAGDINGDGIDDLIVGASYADANGNNSGASYVVFGIRNVTPTFSTDFKTATFTDVDGDLVTVKTTAGTFDTTNFRVFLELGAVTGGGRFSMLDVSDAEFAGANITITAKRSVTLGGDGLVNLGFLDATGVDLGVFSLKGDLGRVELGDGTGASATSLTVSSMGVYGMSTQWGAPNSTVSHVTGELPLLTISGDVSGITLNASSLGTAKITGNVEGATFQIAGALTALTVNGDVLDTTLIIGEEVGSIVPGATSGTYKVLGGIKINGDVEASTLEVGGNVSRLSIGGDVLDGTVLQATGGFGSIESGATSGTYKGLGGIKINGDVEASTLEVGGNVSRLSIGGDVLDGTVLQATGGFGSIESGATSGTYKVLGGIKISGNFKASSLTAETISLVSIGGTVRDESVITASGGFGSIATGATPGSVKIKGGISIAGSLLNSSIKTDGDLAKLGVGRRLDGSTVSARGTDAPADDVAAQTIGAITVLGRVSHSSILAGYDTEGYAVNANVKIRKVTVGTHWIASNLIAGVTAGNDDKWGTADDEVISGGNSIVSSIASLVITGHARGTVGGMDRFGIVAQKVTALSVSGTAIPLTAGASNNLTGFALGSTFDFRVREVAVAA